MTIQITRILHRLSALALVCVVSVHALLHRVRTASDEGSETTEKAVLTAIGLGLAVGLGAAITAVVHKYQGQIH